MLKLKQRNRIFLDQVSKIYDLHSGYQEENRGNISIMSVMEYNIMNDIAAGGLYFHPS